MGVTIKDIAKMAGVSISTVSRVLNGSGYVSDAARRGVEEIIREYNYVPNANARNLKLTESKNIALLVKGIVNPFFNKMVRVIEEKAALRGYPLLIQNVDNRENELDIAIRETNDRNLCGVMLMGGSYGYSEERFRQLGIPCVLVTVSASREVSQELYSSVRIDDEREGFRATEYLIGLGHRRIGYLFNPLSGGEITPNSLRFIGYRRALEAHGISFDTSLVARGQNLQSISGYFEGFNAMKSLLANNRDMTAVFAFADVLAIGAAKAALSSGRRIPEDISVVGFDGVEAAEFYHPSLDTMYQPANEMALSAIEILFDMLQGGAAQHQVFDTVLMKRGSCKSVDSDQ